MLNLILASLFLYFLSPWVHSETNTTDISGTYFCFGTDSANNTYYSAQVTVTKEGDIYRQEGAEEGVDNTVGSFLGTVIFAKDSKDTFATLFWQKNDVTKTGVIIAQIQPDGSWQGLWKWKDRPELNTQICRKSSSTAP